MAGTPRDRPIFKIFCPTPTICASFVEIGNIFRGAAFNTDEKYTYREDTPENDPFKNIFKYFLTSIYC